MENKKTIVVESSIHTFVPHRKISAIDNFLHFNAHALFQLDIHKYKFKHNFYKTEVLER